MILLTEILSQNILLVYDISCIVFLLIQLTNVSENYVSIFQAAGITDVREYRYLDKKDYTIDLQGRYVKHIVCPAYVPYPPE